MNTISELFASRKRSTELGKSTQINFSLDTPFERGVYQQAIKDSAEINGETMSGVFRRLVDSGLIGTAKEVWPYRLCLYDAARKAPTNSYPEKVGVCAALEAAFSEMQHGLNGRATHPYGAPYVQLALALAKENGLVLHQPIAEADPRINLERDFLDLKQLIEKKGGMVPEEIDGIIHSSDEVPVYPVYEWLLSNWHLIGDTYEAYRFLLYVAAATDNWSDTAAERERLRLVCLEVSHRREAWERERSAAALRSEIASTRVEIPICGGDVIIAPRNLIQLNPQDASKSHYVGVLTTRHNKGEYPEFIVFLGDTPQAELADEKTNSFIAAAIELCCELEDQNPIIIPVYDEKDYPDPDSSHSIVIRRAERKE